MTATSPIAMPVPGEATDAAPAAPVAPARSRRAERAAWRAEFDEVVARDYAVLVAECAILIDDRRRAASLVRRTLESLWRDWEQVRRHDSTREVVRARLHEVVVDRPRAARSGWWRRRPRAAGRPGTDTLVALRAMPDVQRRAVVLHHGMGRTPEQIAELEGASTRAIRLRLAHGAHSLAHHHPATPTIPITLAWPDLEDPDAGEGDVG